jgi:hypothetical protein
MQPLKAPSPTSPPNAAFAFGGEIRPNGRHLFIEQPRSPPNRFPDLGERREKGQKTP